MTREEKIKMLDDKLESFMTNAYKNHGQGYYTRNMMCYKLAKLAVNNPDLRVPPLVTKWDDLYRVKQTIKLLKAVGIPFITIYDPTRVRSRMHMYQNSYIIVTLDQ